MKLPPTRESRLANGARLAQVDWPGAPFTEVRIVLPVFRRSRREAALAHVLARLLPLDSGDRDAGAHAERMLRHGATVTSFGAVDRITVSATVPPEECDGVVADILARLERPSFSGDAVTAGLRSEGTRIQQAAAHRETRLNELLLEHRWGPRHPYALATVTEEDLATIGPDDLTDHAHRVLSLEGAAIVAVGDFRTRDDKDWTGIPDRFADRVGAVTSPGATGPLPTEPGPRGGASVFLPTSPDDPTASLRIASPAPVRQHPDHPATHLFSMCLGGYFGSRLVQELRERRGDVYGVSAGFEVLATAASQALMLECPVDRVDAVQETVRTTIAELRSSGPEEQELAEAVRYATHAATVGLSHPAALASAGSTVVFGGDSLGLWDRQAQAARALTPLDVAIAGQRYAGADALTEVTARPNLPARLTNPADPPCG